MDSDVAALRAAAELIRTGGHVKGRLSDDEGRHCIGGALLEVNSGAHVRHVPGGDYCQAQVEAVEAVLFERYPEPPFRSWWDCGWANAGDHAWANMVDWNNADGVTGADVADVLEAAAERLAKRMTHNERTPILRAGVVDDDLQQETSAVQYPLRWNEKEQHLEGGPVYPSPGAIIPPERNFGQAGYVVGMCTHRMAGSEWLAGLRNCERCGG